ncbi:LacI family DNA-binding transcriptional regulator [Egicoccus sp. AB-alg2]|uniref:LacI family DNA-binding transcriptional regulator n=1 Tax=Egicoccus sp. AB-alg2 TaxID=3242693 RepID=UPI00359DD58F
MGRVTLQTIADRLGVSRTTVSNAWSKPDQLSPGLRERILAVADELGYAGPDPAARSLRRGRAGAIGLLLTESLQYAFDDPYAQALLRGVAQATSGADVGLLLVPLPPGADTGQALRSAVVDSFIVYAMPSGHPAVDLVSRRDVPLVAIDTPRLAGVPFIGIDDRAATRELTEAVLADGRRRLLVVTFRVRADDHTGEVTRERIAAATFLNARQRLLGILDAAEARGLAAGDVRIREVRVNERPNAREQVADVLAEGWRPDAIIGISDELALGALEALQDRGLRVPDQVAVAGFDDLPDAAANDLTTVRQPATEKGRRAAAQLLGLEPTGDVVLPHELVLRGTHR